MSPEASQFARGSSYQIEPATLGLKVAAGRGSPFG
jgi:hypothetical protein